MDILADDTLLLDHAGSRIRRALRQSQRHERPFRHWLMRDALPAPLARSVVGLPFGVPDIQDTQGRRETHNASRIFVSAQNRRRYPACETLAEAFQDDATTALIEDLCGVRLDGSFLRIEYRLDTSGFWLEPHTDIGAKLLTLLIYLSDHPRADAWGTDLMDAQGHVLGRAPGGFNDGLMFVPATDTWHGFMPRNIQGIRRSLIVNYVVPDWRARHELAFPETPVLPE